MTFGPVMRSGDLEREVALVGAGIAAVSAVVMLASLFVAWYRFPGFCFGGECPQMARSGWASLGGGRYVLVVTCLCGALPGVGLGSRRVGRALCMVGVAAGLGAGLLIVFRIAVVPDALPGAVYARPAGVFIALLGAGGVAGGSALAGLGPGFFLSARRAVPVLSTILAASVVLIASLFMPWERRRPSFIENNLIAAPSSVVNAWHATPTGAVLIVLGALAIMLACALVAVIRWRSSFFALGVGGWIAAALVAVTTPLATTTHSVGPGVMRLAGYAPGYYICLGAAGVIVLAGVYGAIDAPSEEGRPPHGVSPRHQ